MWTALHHHHHQHLNHQHHYHQQKPLISATSIVGERITVMFVEDVRNSVSTIVAAIAHEMTTTTSMAV